jgi:prevent-host-death family protein
MNIIPATEAKNRFGELLETVHREPVGISKKGRTVAVILSLSAYEDILSKSTGDIQPPAIGGILDWIERHPPKGEPLDERDYAQHLNEKYA